jgi:hypothetical protein
MDVEVHDILGDIFELAQLLLETYIARKQLQRHVDQLHNNE